MTIGFSSIEIISDLEKNNFSGEVGASLFEVSSKEHERTGIET